MKGIIVTPTFFKRRQSNGMMVRSMALYRRLCDKYNFIHKFTDRVEINDYDVAIIRYVPYHNRPSIPPGLLTSECKLIGEFGDLHCWDNQHCLKNKAILFDRYDILLGSYYEKFREWYPQHVHKYIHLPNYFGPYDLYKSLEIKQKPKMKCLLIGAATAQAYPLRMYVIRNRKKSKIDIVRRIPFSKYTQRLNDYFCCLALPGINNIPVAKYFEIPAAGSLMLAVRTKELDICGFEPDVHYVPVNKKNVFDQVERVLSNPQDYMKMKMEGMKFVRENHSEFNRLSVFDKVFETLWPAGYDSLRR